MLHSCDRERAASVEAMAHEARDLSAWNQRHLAISDSQVAIGALSKGRSSGPRLKVLCRRAAAITLATGVRFYWRYVRTWRNVADGPSRGYGLGVAPKAAPIEARWDDMPQEFAKRAHG